MNADRRPETLDLVRLHSTEAEQCLVLSSEAGWNQTRDDWEFLIRVGNAICLRDSDGGLVATGVTLPAAAGVGWIAMILVTVPWRGLGVGRRIMKTLLADTSYRCFALDATDLGFPLYDRLGFRQTERIQRFQVGGSGVIKPADLPRTTASMPFGDVAAQLARRSDVHVVRNESAFGIIRPGQARVHIGPVQASSESDAYELVARVVKAIGGGAIIDVPARAGTFSKRLETLGFEPTRTFIRMSLGCSHFASPGTFAIAGPEFS